MAMGMQVGELFAKIGLDQKEFNSGLKTAENNLKATGSKMDAEGKKISKSFEQVGEKFKAIGAGMTMVGAVIAGGLGKALKVTADFDTQMSKVMAISGATGDEYNALRNLALKLGADTKFSSTTAAAGMLELAAAGMTATNIIAAMPGVLDAAAASGEEIALVAETMGSAINTFGINAADSTHIADILSQVANLSSAGLQDMAYTMKYVGPVAAQLNMSLEEVGASVITMANAGIKGEQAGTTMRSALLSLIGPSKAAGEAMDALGMIVTDKAGNMLPFKDILFQLQEGMAGMGNAEKAAYLADIFGKEAVSGMMVLVDQGPEKFGEYTKALVNSTGASEKAAKIMADNIGGSFEELGGSIETAFISIGDALKPVVRPMIIFIKDMVNAFNALPAPIKTTIATMAALTAAFLLIAGPILIFIGFLPSIVAGIETFMGFSAVIKVIQGVSGAFKLLGLASLAGAGPIFAIAIAIGVLVGAGLAIWKHWDVAGPKIKAALEKIKAVVVGVFKKLADWFWDWGYLLLGPFGFVLKAISEHWDEIKKYAIEVFSKLMDWFWDWGWKMTGPFGAMAKIVKWHFDDIANGGEGAMGAVEDAIQWVIDAIDRLVLKVDEAISKFKEWANVPSPAMPDYITQPGPVKTILDIGGAVSPSNVLGKMYDKAKDFVWGNNEEESLNNEWLENMGNYDSGGIVPGPIGAPQLAVVHGGEEVRTIAQQAGGSAVHHTFDDITVRGVNTKGELVAITRILSDDFRRMGARPRLGVV